MNVSPNKHKKSMKLNNHLSVHRKTAPIFFKTFSHEVSFAFLFSFWRVVVFLQNYKLFLHGQLLL